mmetsp:Transcript_8269/g.15465  ORF Transcript_8269/g.15465 Transcript_8269/m.15465 type:complete len:204 (-) Transcript_8269:1631-2242(-)
MCGSAMCARVMPAMSRRPSFTARRAVLKSMMRVAWSTGNLNSRLKDAATSRCGAKGPYMLGIQVASLLSVSMVPALTLKKSTIPLLAMIAAISKHSSCDKSSSLSPGNFQPGSFNLCDALPCIRMPTTKSGPTWRRISSSTSKAKRTLFANDPPYLSVRRFDRLDQNESIRCPPAKTSKPSKPPSCTRLAARPKSFTTRSMSC